MLASCLMSFKVGMFKETPLNVNLSVSSKLLDFYFFFILKMSMTKLS